MNNEKLTMFVSFNYESKAFVDSLEKKMPKSTKLIRYEDGVSTWGSFQEFMDTISEQNFAVLVISEKYLQSPACMYEVITLMKDQNWKRKTMFVVMPGTNIYKLEDRIPYIQFWNDRYENLSKMVTEAGLPATATKDIEDKIHQTTVIRDQMDVFLQTVSDSNNPLIFDAIDEICKKVEISERTRFQMLLDNGDCINMKDWGILALLQENPGLSSSEIANRLGLSKATTYRIINNLLKQGKIIVQSETYRHYHSGRMSSISRTYQLAV